MKLIQWRHVCDITTIRTTSQKTTPTAKQPLFRAPREKLIVFYSSLAVSHGVEVRSRTNEAKTAAFEQRHSCRIHTHTHAHQQCHNYLHQITTTFRWIDIVVITRTKNNADTQGQYFSHTVICSGALSCGSAVIQHISCHALGITHDCKCPNVPPAHIYSRSRDCV